MTTELVRRHPVWVLAVVLTVFISIPVGVALYASWHNWQELEAQNERLIDYQVTSRVEPCQSSNRGREALQEVLDRIADPPDEGVAAINFSDVAGFNDLEPAVQFFLENLESILNEPGGSELMTRLANDYRESNPSDVDCDAVGTELRKELTNA